MTRRYLDPIENRLNTIEDYRQTLLDTLRAWNYSRKNHRSKELTEFHAREALKTLDEYRKAAHTPLDDVVLSNQTIHSLYQRLQDDPGADLWQEMTLRDYYLILRLRQAMANADSESLTKIEDLLKETPV